MNFQIINDIKSLLLMHEEKKYYGNLIIKFNFYNGEIKNVNFTTERSKVYAKVREKTGKSA